MDDEKGKPLFQKVALIGIGLIGSSLARAIKKKALASEVVTCARSEATRNTVEKLGLVDAVYDSPAEAVRDADLVILCTPVSTYDDLAAAMAPSLKAGAIVSDVGSVKESVIRDVGQHLPDGVHFVPGHPIAGTEHSGPEAGFAELFEGRWCILTPVVGTDARAIEKVSNFWAALGSMVEIMTPHRHDKVLAITSHLPHLIAYTIVGTATDLEETDQNDVIKFSAGGFRDFTRIAASDPIMWRDVFLNNREAVLEMLQRFTEDLTVLQRAVRWGEGDVLEDLFRRTREVRRGIVDAHQAGTFDAREPDDELKK
ncbi:prephenate/arogenate dehydrogenase family protein [Kiloniella laminariae]|uniref:prephenate/arogenate dehydrogenase family protein n=1 Tax=Kiloniella laminariae TaxID=454162 RepID=UPI00037CA1FC|nr:prephenate/arogenate dehydrogenase family protein [Kiloniella laminariae]